jgi:hypothetical protein
VPAQLALFVYVIASTLGLGYACVRGLTLTRRITVCLLALVLEVSAGMLLVDPHTTAGYVVGIPAMLALGLVMTAPRRTRAEPLSPGWLTPAIPLLPRQLGRRPATALTAARRPAGRSVPVLADPWAALYASMAGEVTAATHPGRAGAPRNANLGRRASDRRAAGKRIAVRTLRRRPRPSATFRRSWKCKCQ